MNKFKFLIAGFLSLVLGATAAVGVASSQKITHADAAVDNSTFFRLYFHVDWDIVDGSMKVNGTESFVLASSAPSKYDQNVGKYVIDIPCDESGWSFVAFEFQQTDSYWYANTENSPDSYVLSTNVLDLSKSSFKPGFVYQVILSKYEKTLQKTRDNKSIKLFSYTVSEEELLSSPIEYDFVAELTNDSSYPQKNNLYLNAGVWDVDGAVFEAWVWGNGLFDDFWLLFNKTTTIHSKKYYYGELPNNVPYTNVAGFKVLRKGPSHASQSWACWNETNDISPSGKNAVTITGWNGSDFSTSTVPDLHIASDFSHHFHIFNSESGFRTIWMSRLTTNPSSIYINDGTKTIVSYSISLSVEVNKAIFGSIIVSRSHDKYQSSEFVIGNYGNGVYGLTINSKVADTTSAAVDMLSKDKTLAYTFLRKFSELGRIEGNVCTAVEANMDLYYECVAIYNSFNHATYVDSKNDATYEGKQKTIKDTMDWLSNKYGTEPGEGVNAKQNILLANKNIGDSNIIIVAFVAISLIGIAALVIAKRKRLQK